MFDKNTLAQTTQNILRKSALGIIIGIGAGSVFGVLDSSLEWLFHPPLHPSLTKILFYTQTDIQANALIIGVPATLIGFVMGLCSTAYKNRHFPHLLWQAMTSLSVISAFWISGFNETGPVRFIFLVPTISFITSWLIYRSIRQELYVTKWNSNPIVDTIYLIGGIIILFVTNYFYFRFLFDMFNVSS